MKALHAACCAFVIVLGCASTVDTHARIAERLYGPIVDAKTQIEVSAYNDAARARVAACSDAEAAEAIDDLRTRYALVEGAVTLAVAAYNAYVDAVRDAHDGSDDAQAEAARLLIERWEAMRSAASSIGVAVSPLPIDLVRASQ